jgi:hypothetical protein
LWRISAVLRRTGFWVLSYWVCVVEVEVICSDMALLPAYLLAG